MKKWLVFGVLTALIATTPVWGQDEEEEEKDVVEIHLMGGIAVPAGDFAKFSDTLGVRIGYSTGVELGYFVTPSWVAGLHFTYSQFDVHREGDYGSLKHRLFTPMLYVRYLIPTSGNFEPFVKASIGIENPKLVTYVQSPAGDRYRELSYDPSLAIGISAGLTYYTSYYSGPFVEVGYRNAFSKDSEKIYSQQPYTVGSAIGVIDVRFGFRILFGGE